MQIDIAFDFRSDTPAGQDPDAKSPTLRRYHQLLWSKQLPGGQAFDLSAAMPGTYLYHSSPLGEFRLSSDTVTQTFLKPAFKAVTSQSLEAENAAFETFKYTMGGMMVFPGNRIDGMTINQARGCNRAISDRFDLTVECIRRHYVGESSPLAATLTRYADFLDLFGDFPGYVSFFLLNDVIDEDCSVKFFMPFDDFRPPAIPKDLDTYRDYRRRSIEFIEARNQRVEQLNL